MNRRRRNRQYERERRAIEATARALAERAYGSDRWPGVEKLDPSIMAYWRGQASLAWDIYQDYANDDSEDIESP
jgi:hypothetical protein